MTQEQLQKLDTMAKPRSEEAVKKAEERKRQRECKELLLQDLSARLPYGVKVYHPDYLEPQTLDTVFNFDAWQDGGIQCNVDDVGDRPSDMIYCKPYLRPMSSMTVEEKKELNNVLEYQYYADDSCMCEASDWLNAHHFDYRRLIEKGLAIAVTKDNNPYEY